MLVVLRTMESPDHFRLIGRSAESRLPTRRCLKDRRQPEISLASIARPGGKSPRGVIHYANTWSRGGARDLVTWLTQLWTRLGDRLKLVIEDKTGFEIPWEMLTLPVGDDPHDRVFLGAVVPVTRWQMRTLAEEHDDVYSEASVECAGRIAAYLNDELSEIENEVRSLDGLGAERYWDAPEFQEFLQSGEGEYALVYLGCHGVMGDGIDTVALGSRRNAKQQLTFSSLDWAALRLLARSRSAVFLNACHSGRFFEDRMLQDDLLYGFPDLFLRQGARGVIATTGEVSDRFAVEIGRSLLRAAVEAPNAPLPALIQRERADLAARHARGEIGDVPLVSAFMYVYYGNPRCTLRIAAAK